MVTGPFFCLGQHSRQLNSLVADCNEAERNNSFYGLPGGESVGCTNIRLRFRGSMLRNQIGTRD